MRRDARASEAGGGARQANVRDGGAHSEPMRFGHPRLHLRRCGSTNDVARALAARGAPHGTVVTADEQTAGRGRQGRRWQAPPKSALLASFVLRTAAPPAGTLSLAVALAVAETAELAVPGLAARVKWPNDVLADGRKLAGILIESRALEGWTVVGIGINVHTEEHQFPPELAATATSLAIEARRAGTPSPTIESVLETLCTTLARWTSEDGQAEVAAAWPRRDALAGRRVSWDGGSGTARGVDREGRLIVETARGTVALAAGEVHLGSGAERGD